MRDIQQIPENEEHGPLITVRMLCGHHLLLGLRG